MKNKDRVIKGARKRMEVGGGASESEKERVRVNRGEKKIRNRRRKSLLYSRRAAMYIKRIKRAAYFNLIKPAK
jgi:hypothetical protein